MRESIRLSMIERKAGCREMIAVKLRMWITVRLLSLRAVEYHEIRLVEATHNCRIP